MFQPANSTFVSQQISISTGEHINASQPVGLVVETCESKVHIS
jgi:hypothetical protein